MGLSASVAMSVVRALRPSRVLRGAQHLSTYSEVGAWSTFSIRQRYTILLKNQTDPAIADFFYEHWLHAWVGDAPSYNYWFCTSMAMGCMVAILSRHWFFNPDLYGRRQENKKPMPDRHRQWSYSLPYFNHRMQNMCTKFKFAFIDNEPDYSDIHPAGYRPNRKQIHRRPWSYVFSIPRYTCEDPLFTSVSHANMTRIYEDCGYTKKAKSEDDE